MKYSHKFNNPTKNKAVPYKIRLDKFAITTLKKMNDLRDALLKEYDLKYLLPSMFVRREFSIFDY